MCSSNLDELAIRDEVNVLAFHGLLRRLEYMNFMDYIGGPENLDLW